MGRLRLLAAVFALAIAAGALAQDEPEGKLWLRGVYTATYSWHSAVLDSNKTGAVATHNDDREEMWDRITLIFNEHTTWKYREGVPVEMQDDASVTGSGGGGLRNVDDHVTAINKGGEWAPYHYVVTEDGNWTYSVPTKPHNEGMPPLMASGGSVVVTAPMGIYTLIFNPYPNTDDIAATGSHDHRMRPKRDPGALRDTEDEQFPIDKDHNPPGDPRARYLVSDAYHKMQELLMPATGIQGRWKVENGGFATSGHLSDRGGPGTETTHTDPVNDGDRQSTGLTIVSKSNWTADVSWSFTYNKSPIEAIIKPTGEYKKWVPTAGSKAGKAGSTIGFKVELRDKKTGAKPKNTTATFRFKLIETSKYPGSCMNSPWNDTEPDMKIVKDQNQGLAEVDDDGQGAHSKDKLTECPITVSCFDGGGTTRLQVIAELTDAPEVIGHLDDGTEEIALPCDEDSNHIADAWEEDKGVKGQAGEVDDEQDPPGDRTNGDGLALWEEYRGFLEGGKHIRGDPKKKDYFIADTVGGRVKPGISLFKTVSKLEVHSDLTVEEMGTDRVINRNHGDGPHVVDQHGILVGQRETDGTCEAISDIKNPSTPRDIREVVIDPQVQSVKTVGGKSYSEINSFIAHELLHACCVYHHGQGDRTVWWHAETEPDGHKVVYEYASADDVGHKGMGVCILARSESGTALAASNWNAPRTIWLGIPGGQHSGCEDCIMRYDCSQAYAAGNVRYYLYGAQAEIPGFGLCLDATGTGVNAAGHAPQSRYSDATKGDCADQIRVKDAY